jgi:hypothetical protein
MATYLASRSVEEEELEGGVRTKIQGLKGLFHSRFDGQGETAPRAESHGLCGLSLFRLTPRQHFRPFRKEHKSFLEASPGRAQPISRAIAGKKGVP